jgi:DNA-binding transcriptional regulator WhiA
MDDGHKTKSGYILNIHSFSLEECSMLCNVLFEKFNLKTSIQKDRGFYRLYIAAESALLFKSLIEPHLVSCMNYKLI